VGRTPNQLVSRWREANLLEMKGTTAAALLVSMAGVMPLACARHAASQATAGALSTFSEKATATAAPGETPVEALAGRAVDGTIAHLSDPRSVAALQVVTGAAASAAVDQAMATATRWMEGEVRAAVAETARQAAASATDGALRRVFPGCPAGDTTSFDRRLGELSRLAAAGFARGLKDALGITALVLAFLAGAVITLLVVMAVRHARARRELRATLAAHPA
jgi:hypothetical protein